MAEDLRRAFEREMGIQSESPATMLYQQWLERLNTQIYDAAGFGECRARVIGGYELTGSQVLARLREIILEKRAREAREARETARGAS